MLDRKILDEIKSRLAAAHGDRLRGVILYGSEARGDARSDSDIDLLVLLERPIRPLHDYEAGFDALYPLALEIGRRISVKVVDAQEYRTLWCPLYESAKREGVLV